MDHLPTIRCERTARRTWSLLDGQGRVQGILLRPQWYSINAEIITDHRVFRVGSIRAWSGDIAVYAGDVPLLRAHYQWHAVSIRDLQGNELFRIIRKNWVGRSYQFVDPSGTVRLGLRVGINWCTFDRTFTFTGTAGDAMEPLHVLFGIRAIIVQLDRTAAMA